MFDTQQITQEAIGNLQARYFELGRQLYFTGSLDDPVAPYHDSPLGQRIALLVDVANGNSRDEHLVYEALLAVSTTMECVRGRTQLDEVIQHVQLWLHRDELITLSEAAMLLRGSTENRDRVYVRDLIDRGDLAEYTDPNEPNPMRNKRVSRSQVAALAESI